MGLPAYGTGAGAGSGIDAATVVSLRRLRLNMADPTDVTRVIGACLLLTLLGQGLSHLLSRHCPLLPASLRQAYGRLARAKRDEWNTRVWSSVHAILVSVYVPPGSRVRVYAVRGFKWVGVRVEYTNKTLTSLPLPQAVPARTVGRGARHPGGHAASLRRGALRHRHHHWLPAGGRAARGLLHPAPKPAAALARVGVRPHLGARLHARAPPRRCVSQWLSLCCVDVVRRDALG